jgi:hypothetical protein
MHSSPKRAMNGRVTNPKAIFSIGFAVSRSRDLLRRLAKEHAPDDARQMLAERVVEHLEQSGFEVDEDGQALRLKPSAPLHRTPE